MRAGEAVKSAMALWSSARIVWAIGLLIPTLSASAALSAVPMRQLSAQEPVAIRPGMTEAEVRAAWGEPLTVRKTGDMTYLYFRNDCFRRCGTWDVVFLEGGQVVDAIVRDSHRRYDGVSSSPVERKPVVTRTEG